MCIRTPRLPWEITVWVPWLSQTLCMFPLIMKNYKVCRAKPCPEHNLSTTAVIEVKMFIYRLVEMMISHIMNIQWRCRRGSVFPPALHTPDFICSGYDFAPTNKNKPHIFLPMSLEETFSSWFQCRGRVRDGLYWSSHLQTYRLLFCCLEKVADPCVCVCLWKIRGRRRRTGWLGSLRRKQALGPGGNLHWKKPLAQVKAAKGKLTSGSANKSSHRSVQRRTARCWMWRDLKSLRFFKIAVSTL